MRLLEGLVSKKAIVRQEKGAVLLCPKCGGYANMPILVCPRCGSTKISRKEDLFHSECEYWGPTEGFIDGLLLRCPRCDELLDEKALEGTSGYFSISDPYFECHDCGAAVSKNNITMVCVKCKNKYTTIQAAYLNSVSYILAPGVAIKHNELPPKKLAEKVEGTQPRIEPETEPETETTLVEEAKPKTPEDTELSSLKKADAKHGMDHRDSETVKENSPESPSEKQPEKKSEASKLVAEVIAEEETADEPVEEPDEHQEPILDEQIQELIIETESEENVESALEKKLGSELLQSSIKRVSKLFRKTAEKSPPKIKKRESEPEYGEEEYENEDYEKEEEIDVESPLPSEPKPIQILMIVENVTVSEFIIESLERIKKPINVTHVDEGSLALKELRYIYDALIIDLDLKTIDSKIILSEMEKWSIMTPLIVLSDQNPRMDKYILNIEAVLKKKQGDINNLRKILKKLL